MRTLQFFSLLTISLFLSFGLTRAQNVVFGDPQKPTMATAINDLEVGGIHYDVVFQLSTFAFEIYGDFPGTFNIFDIVSEAETAVDSVSSALNGAGARSIGNLDQPGVESAIYNIGYESFLLGEIQAINVWRAATENDNDWFSLGQNQWTYNLDERSWAVFTMTTTGVEDNDVTKIPSNFKLHQNFPNPFNPSTTIQYQLPNATNVEITIFNLFGQQVWNRQIKNQTAGQHEINIDLSNYSSGAYFYRLEAGDYTAVKKMILMK